MRKLFVLAMLMLTFRSFAQNAKETKIEILKSQADAIVATYTINADLVEDALKKRFADAKLGSGDKAKGFRVYKGVVFPEFSTEKVDIYTKVDGKKENSSVTIAVSKGYNNFINASTDPETVEKIKKFLDAFYYDVVRYKNNKEIEAQEEVVSKAERVHNNNVEEAKDLEKEMEKLKNKIEENKDATEKSKETLTKESALLEELKTKLKDLK